MTGAGLVEITMPSLGADMEAGKLVRWLCAPGDTLARGDPVAEVETDKGIIVVEVFQSGTVESLVARPGDEAPVGAVLATLRPAGEALPASPAAVPPPPPPAAVAPVAPVAPSPSPSPAALPPAATPVHVAPPAPVAAPPAPVAASPAPVAAPPGGGFVRASGLARRLARERGLALGSLRGSGPGGAVLAADLATAGMPARGEPAAPAAAPPARDAMRRAIGAAMARSKREIPHFYVGTTIDMGPALDWLRARNDGLPPEGRAVPAVLVVASVARALRRVPELNARWEGAEAPPSPRVHVGVAVALRGGGLVAPAIHDTDTLSLDRLAEAFRDVVERAKRGGLRGSELTEATLTLTSLGDRGVELLVPIVFWPQVAIVGAGKIVERPWVVEGRVVPRPLLQLTLSADHRVVDGHRAALFLAAVEEQLRAPEQHLVAPAPRRASQEAP